MVESIFTHAAEANYSATEGELLAQADALGTDHVPFLCLMANRNLDSIDNLRLVCLKQKTLGWRFKVVYIPGKKLGWTMLCPGMEYATANLRKELVTQSNCSVVVL